MGFQSKGKSTVILKEMMTNGKKLNLPLMSIEILQKKVAIKLKVLASAFSMKDSEIGDAKSSKHYYMCILLINLIAGTISSSNTPYLQNGPITAVAEPGTSTYP